MSYLRNILTNVVTAALDYEGAAYRALIAQRTTAVATVTPDPNVAMEEGGPYTIGIGEPIWEEVPSERASTFPNRCLVGVLDAAAVGADTQVLLTAGLTNDITVTKATYTPVSAIKGADTNSRTLKILSGTETGVWHEKEAPTTNIVAKAALVKEIESAAGAEKALTLESSEKLAVKAGTNVVAVSQHVGTGIADPGGIVLVTYTHD
jgi:hypothetical protein